MYFKKKLPKAEVSFNGDTYTFNKLVVNDQLSEETVCFSAELLRNGSMVAYVSNRGCGGCNDLTFTDHDFAKSLCYEQWNHLSEHVTEQLLELTEILKFTKKHQSEGLVLKKIVTEESGISYPDVSLSTFKVDGKKLSIKEILANKKGKEHLLKTAIKYEAKGYEILNSNLSSLNQ